VPLRIFRRPSAHPAPQTGPQLDFTYPPGPVRRRRSPEAAGPRAGFAAGPIRSGSADPSPSDPPPAVGRAGHADRAEQSRDRPKWPGAVI
jgi:hypothetical protein